MAKESHPCRRCHDGGGALNQREMQEKRKCKHRDASAPNGDEAREKCLEEEVGEVRGGEHGNMRLQDQGKGNHPRLHEFGGMLFHVGACGEIPWALERHGHTHV